MAELAAPSVILARLNAQVIAEKRRTDAALEWGIGQREAAALSMMLADDSADTVATLRTANRVLSWALLAAGVAAFAGWRRR